MERYDKEQSRKTLMKLKKSDLVEVLLIAYHNKKVVEELLDQQAKNVKDWEPVVHCHDCCFYQEQYVRCSHPHGLRIVESENNFCSLGKENKDEKLED